MNELQILAKLVKEMRKAQHDYFRCQDFNIKSGLLKIAKVLELQVDQLCKEIIEGKEGTLF